MEKEIVIIQSLNEKTLVKVGNHILFTSPLVFIFMPILLVMCINSFSQSYENLDVTVSENIFLSLLTFIPLLFPILIVWWTWYKTKKTILNNFRKNPRYFTNVTLKLDDSGLAISGNEFQNKNHWENYIKIKEKENWFLIYSAKRQAQVIDKSQLSNDTIENLRSLFRQLPPKIKVSLK